MNDVPLHWAPARTGGSALGREPVGEAGKQRRRGRCAWQGFLGRTGEGRRTRRRKPAGAACRSGTLSFHQRLRRRSPLSHCNSVHNSGLSSRVHRFRRLRRRRFRPLPQPGDEPRVQRRNQIAQSAKGVIVFVDGVLVDRRPFGRRRVAVQPGLRQQLRARRAVDLQPARPQPRRRRRDAQPDVVVGPTHRQPRRPQLLNLRARRPGSAYQTTPSGASRPARRNAAACSCSGVSRR